MAEINVAMLVSQTVTEAQAQSRLKMGRDYAFHKKTSVSHYTFHLYRGYSQTGYISKELLRRCHTKQRKLKLRN